eukprot:2912212-Pyramimonas_sp.AAC.1
MSVLWLKCKVQGCECEAFDADNEKDKKCGCCEHHRSYHTRLERPAPSTHLAATPPTATPPTVTTAASALPSPAQIVGARVKLNPWASSYGHADCCSGFEQRERQTAIGPGDVPIILQTRIQPRAYPTQGQLPVTVGIELYCLRCIIRDSVLTAGLGCACFATGNDLPLAGEAIAAVKEELGVSSKNDGTAPARGIWCTIEGCAETAQGSTPYCNVHGGDTHCVHRGCTKSAHAGSPYCVGHGRQRRCEREDCTKLARGSTSYCAAHGGGRRCQHEGCTKSALSITPFCVAHGGGRRCETEGCG